MTLIQPGPEQGDLQIGGNFVNKLTRLSQFLSPVRIYWLLLTFDSLSVSQYVSQEHICPHPVRWLAMAHPLDKRLATTGGYFIVTVNWVRMGWEGLCVIMLHSLSPSGYQQGRGGKSQVAFVDVNQTCYTTVTPFDCICLIGIIYEGWKDT